MPGSKPKYPVDSVLYLEIATTLCVSERHARRMVEEDCGGSWRGLISEKRLKELHALMPSEKAALKLYYQMSADYILQRERMGFKS